MNEKRNVWDRPRDEINISTNCSLLGFNMTMWKNIETICERNSEIYYLRTICSVSVGVILRKGSVEFHTLACHCEHVHIVRSWIQAFGYFLLVSLQVLLCIVTYLCCCIPALGNYYGTTWCERCFDNHSSFHSSQIRNAMSKVVAPEPFGFHKM